MLVGGPIGISFIAIAAIPAIIIGLPVWIGRKVFLRFHITTQRVLLLGRPLQKTLRLHRFKSDYIEIWQDCSSS